MRRTIGARLLTRGLRGAQKSIKYVDPVPPGRARGLVAEIYQQMEQDWGLVAPPISLHSPAPDVMGASWLMVRESLLMSGSADRALKEAVASAVSEANACPYCVEVHEATQVSMGATDRAPSVKTWVEGGPWPFSHDQLVECVGVAVAFEYLNRMNNVFLPESPVPERVPRMARGRVRATIGRAAAPGDREVEPGRSLVLLPGADLPEDLHWASSRPTVAGAFARASAAIDSAGARSLPSSIRDLVQAQLRGEGVEVGLSRTWTDRSVASLPSQQRATARLALLTAVSAYQVDSAVVEAVRNEGVDDAALVDLTAWASMAAARHAASRYLGGR